MQMWMLIYKNIIIENNNIDHITNYAMKEAFKTGLSCLSRTT